MSVNNLIYKFEPISLNVTKVSVATAHGLSNGSIVEILNSVDYHGSWTVSNVDAYSFEIATTFVSNEQNCKWQITRSRPVIVNPTGETIDTLRQAVNQISADLGNKYELDSQFSDKQSLVKAINELKNEGAILSLIVSIAVN